MTAGMSTFAVIIGFMVLMGGIAALSWLLPQPVRPCPECEQDVRLTARHCRNCGYRFGPDGKARWVR